MSLSVNGLQLDLSIFTSPFQLQTQGAGTANQSTPATDQTQQSPGSLGSAAVIEISVQAHLLASGGQNGQSSPLGQTALDAAANALGLDPSTLQSDLQSGESLQSIAQAQKVTLSNVQSAITSAVQPQLDQAVSAGQMTSQQEQDVLKRLTNLGSGGSASNRLGPAGQYSAAMVKGQGHGHHHHGGHHSGAGAAASASSSNSATSSTSTESISQILSQLLQEIESGLSSGATSVSSTGGSAGQTS